MDSSDLSPCEWACRQLAELRDHGLDPATASMLQAHLSECGRCRQEADWDARLGTILRQVSLPVPPTALRQAVRRRLYQRSLRRVAFGAAAAALLGGVIITWEHGRQPPLKSFAAPSGVSLDSAASSDLFESRMLFAAPPVDRLGVLAHQEAGFMAALQEMLEKE